MSNSFKFLFIFLGFIFFQTAIYAKSDSNELNNLLSSIQTMQADFTQTILDASGKSIQQSRGKMVLQRPGKFRWEVTQPIAQLIIANGSRIFIYDPDLEQVTIRSLKNAAGDAPALLLSNTLSLEKNFHVQKIKNNTSSMQWFELTPKDRSSMLSIIKLGFLNNQIHTMQLQDSLGHRSVIEFKSIRLGGKVSQKLFVFIPPKHSDVIDDTRR